MSWLYLIFISFSLFAEEPAPVDHETKMKAPPSEKKEISLPLIIEGDINQYSHLLLPVLKAIEQKNWIENRAPGPVFNTCDIWATALQCYWAVFRVNRLTGHHLKSAQMLAERLTSEGLKKEMDYLQAFPHYEFPYGRAWFLLLTVEFYLWAEERGLPDPDRLFPMANVLSEQLFQLVGNPFPFDRLSRDNAYRAIFPFALYTLYRYAFVLRNEELLAQVRSVAQNYFLHRNDGSPIDLEAKAQACAKEKLAGIHRDYLMKKDLLLPGYEEFERRTAEEDLKRRQNCEAIYERLSFEKPEEPKGFLSSGYYNNILRLLMAIGGKEALRHFIRHNPPSPVEFQIPKKDRHRILIIFAHLSSFAFFLSADNDEEWQLEWSSLRDSITEGQKTVESSFSIYMLFFAAEFYTFHKDSD